MRAVLCPELGSIDNLVVGERDAPAMIPGGVRVGVKAAGINFPDMLMAEGKYQVKPALPSTPGLEVAGEVLECAPGVTHVKPGGRVLACARHGISGRRRDLVLAGQKCSVDIDREQSRRLRQHLGGRVREPSGCHLLHLVGSGPL